jgi:hypothetical protein
LIGTTTLIRTTFSITTLSKPIKKSNTSYHNNENTSLSITLHSVSFMLSAVIKSIMLSANLINVIILSVVEPSDGHEALNGH